MEKYQIEYTNGVSWYRSDYASGTYKTLERAREEMDLAMSCSGNVLNPEKYRIVLVSLGTRVQVCPVPKPTQTPLFDTDLLDRLGAHI